MCVAHGIQWKQPYILPLATRHILVLRLLMWAIGSLIFCLHLLPGRNRNSLVKGQGRAVSPIWESPRIYINLVRLLQADRFFLKKKKIWMCYLEVCLDVKEKNPSEGHSCILAKLFHAFLSGLLLKCIVKNKGLYILVYVNLLSMRKCMESEIIWETGRGRQVTNYDVTSG